MDGIYISSGTEPAVTALFPEALGKKSCCPSVPNGVPAAPRLEQRVSRLGCDLQVDTLKSGRSALGRSESGNHGQGDVEEEGRARRSPSRLSRHSARVAPLSSVKRSVPSNRPLACNAQRSLQQARTGCASAELARALCTLMKEGGSLRVSLAPPATEWQWLACAISSRPCKTAAARMIPRFFAQSECTDSLEKRYG